MSEDRHTVLAFCPACFASEEDGSAAHTCDDHYCYNCGATGTARVPRWAIDRIRRTASWVGKRYYPDDEDREIQAELKVLRPLMPDHETDRWEVVDYAPYTPTPELPQPRLELRRRSGEKSVRSQTHRLPHPYTEEDVERAKARLRQTMRLSHEYLKDHL